LAGGFAVVVLGPVAPVVGALDVDGGSVDFGGVGGTAAVLEALVGGAVNGGVDARSVGVGIGAGAGAEAVTASTGGGGGVEAAAV
jgi:hypothetical protein